MKALLVFLLILSGFNAFSAVLVEENGHPVESKRVRTRFERDGFDFRRDRKFGVGLGAAGVLGLAGPQIELNFSEDISWMGGFGFGPKYQTFHMQIKKVLRGRWFLPYIAGGFARWYTVREDQNFAESTPGFLSKRFLNEREKSTGEFSENFIYPSLGIQYLQLNGEWAGASLYAEVTLLIDIDDFVSAATGGLGLIYYF